MNGRFEVHEYAPGKYRLILDGRDISAESCAGFEVRAEFGKGPAQVTLHPCIVEMHADLPDAWIVLSPEVEDLLLRFGWSPPPGQDPIERRMPVAPCVPDAPALDESHVREDIFRTPTGDGWRLRLTHVPTGLMVETDSDRFRSPERARGQALRWLAWHVAEGWAVNADADLG